MSIANSNTWVWKRRHVDAFGNVVGESLAKESTSGSSYVSPEEKLRDDFWAQVQAPQIPAPVSAAERQTIMAMFDDTGLEGTSVQPTSKGITQIMAEINAATGAKSGGVVPRAEDSMMRNALYVPGIDDPRQLQVSEIGGHFTKPQIIGQAFVGVQSPIPGREFTQDDLNLIRPPGRLLASRDRLGREQRYEYPETLTSLPLAQTDARGGRQSFEWSAPGPAFTPTQSSPAACCSRRKSPG